MNGLAKGDFNYYLCIVKTAQQLHVSTWQETKFINKCHIHRLW